MRRGLNMENNKVITLAHGSGGKMTHQLIKDVFFKHMGNDILDKCEDSALVDVREGKMAFTTDSFVVKPVFFPGGDIGKLAICGTVNDLAVAGADPKYITCGFILEEGFPQADLERIVVSMSEWARKAGVKIVAGDTKVVERGEADGIFINTAGIGQLIPGAELGIEKIVPGDKVIISGTMGDHGVAILSKREGLKFNSDISSDCAPLGNMLSGILKDPQGIKFMRDPTRGGLATTLNEIVGNENYGILVDETKVPVNETVQGACELLGLDALYIANEGKAIIIIDPSREEDVLDILRASEYGKDAATIGEITKGAEGKVCLKTTLGVVRTIDMLTAEQLPRIC